MNHNYISANRKSAINAYGMKFNVGDHVTHQDAEAGVAIITAFEINEEIGEVKAHTNMGYAHVDFIEPATAVTTYQ